RRRWPELLFSSSRLLSGRFRDPLVGRDVLAGILLGVMMVLVFEACYAIPNWVDLAGMMPVPPDTSTMGSVAGSVSRLLMACFSLRTALGFRPLRGLSRGLLRRRWLAIGLSGLLLVALNLSGANYAVEIPVQIVTIALGLLAAVRFGVLAFIVSNA